MLTLNGKWLLAADPQNEGRGKRYYDAIRPDAQPVSVPGEIHQVFPDRHGVFWYYHVFTPQMAPLTSQRVLLRFGAVDYLADVWLNGQHVGAQGMGHEGGETPFDTDITTALKPGEANLLAVRVLNPCKENIDGFVLAEIPHRNKFDADQFQPGMSYNYGGILLPVSLEVVPAVRIADVFAQPQVDSGRIPISVTVTNVTGSRVIGRLAARVAPAAEGQTLATVAIDADFPAGDSTHELELAVDQPRLWDIDDPYLYRVTTELEGGGFGHDFSVRCGFRDFRIVNGFFHLNGRRVFLRSTHTGNHFPIGQVVPPEPDLMRRDFIMAKVSGYNAVRFIAGVAYPEQLDFCDEIGLMVYEENLASWCLGDSPHMAERFDLSFREMIRRDRNHASVTIWGMLNETQDGPVFRHAVEALKLVRSLDQTRLVLLGSGRWDGQPTIGSASNPGSAEWEPVWGVEGPDAPKVDAKLTWTPGGYVDRAGDAHVYPILPQSDEYTNLVRTMGGVGADFASLRADRPPGNSCKPVFLSEYGVGSQFNSIDELRRYEQAGAGEHLPDAALIRSEAERFKADLRRFKLEGVYPFPEDFLRDSYRHSVEQRRSAFDVVRSNPSLCGYNLTGMLDHGLTGEGMWTLWREWKPGAADCLRDGWAPVRWCLFVNPMHGYPGRPIQVEAVLANEDVLAPGEYAATFRIFEKDRGIVWQKNVTVSIPKPEGAGPMSVPALNETVKKLPAGEYVFAASMHVASEFGDRRSFRISDPAPPGRAKGPLTLLGIDRRTASWLAARGYRCSQFDPASRKKNELIVVGAPKVSSKAAELWAALRDRVEKGATAVFASAKPFLTRMITPPEGWTPPAVFPLGDAVKAREFHDWLYHKDIMARRHPVFDGLHAGGLLDWGYYGHVLGHAIYDCTQAPDEVIAAAFAVGYCCRGGYDSGVVIAALNRGKGRIILNSLQVLEYLDRHPAADRLLLNLIREAQRE